MRWDQRGPVVGLARFAGHMGQLVEVRTFEDPIKQDNLLAVPRG
jgi:hypothetical protein